MDGLYSLVQNFPFYFFILFFFWLNPTCGFCLFRYIDRCSKQMGGLNSCILQSTVRMPPPPQPNSDFWSSPYALYWMIKFIDIFMNEIFVRTYLHCIQHLMILIDRVCMSCLWIKDAWSTFDDIYIWGRGWMTWI